MELTPEQQKIQRVVCAAIRYTFAGQKHLILGPRHYDRTMHEAIDRLSSQERHAAHYGTEQGFIDQWGNFLTRKEAWWVAVCRDQIIRYVGNQTPESRREGADLNSENLY